jgi:hypothetical protein
MVNNVWMNNKLFFQFTFTFDNPKILQYKMCYFNMNENINGVAAVVWLIYLEWSACLPA